MDPFTGSLHRHIAAAQQSRTLEKISFYNTERKPEQGVTARIRMGNATSKSLKTVHLEQIWPTVHAATFNYCDALTLHDCVAQQLAAMRKHSRTTFDVQALRPMQRHQIPLERAECTS